MFGLGDVVLDKCYASLESFSVRNTRRDAWTGHISVTVDSEEVSLVCDHCTGNEFSGHIAVDGDDDSTAQGSVYCHNGAECIFRLAGAKDPCDACVTDIVEGGLCPCFGENWEIECPNVEGPSSCIGISANSCAHDLMIRILSACKDDSDEDEYRYDCESFLVPSTKTTISDAGSIIGEHWSQSDCEYQCSIQENCVAFLSEQRVENGETYCWMFSEAGDDLVAVDDIQSGYVDWQFCYKRLPVTTEYQLVFRQTIPYLYSPNELRLNPEDPSSDNYAILDELERFRKKDGRFYFRMVWPGDDIVYEWSQTSNPVFESVEGYEAISVPFTGQYWGGLEASASALMDGSVNHSNWFYAVGSHQLWNGGIPSYAKSHEDYDYPQQAVELYVAGCPDITSLAIIGDYFGTPITNSLPISFRLTAHITSWNSYLVLSQDTPSTLATRNFVAALIIRSGSFAWNDIKDGAWGAETEHTPSSIQLNSAFTIEGTVYSSHISLTVDGVDSTFTFRNGLDANFFMVTNGWSIDSVAMSCDPTPPCEPSHEWNKICDDCVCDASDLVESIDTADACKAYAEDHGYDHISFNNEKCHVAYEIWCSQSKTVNGWETHMLTVEECPLETTVWSNMQGFDSVCSKGEASVDIRVDQSLYDESQDCSTLCESVGSYCLDAWGVDENERCPVGSLNFIGCNTVHDTFVCSCAAIDQDPSRQESKVINYDDCTSQVSSTGSLMNADDPWPTECPANTAVVSVETKEVEIDDLSAQRKWTIMSMQCCGLVDKLTDTSTSSRIPEEYWRTLQSGGPSSAEAQWEVQCGPNAIMAGLWDDDTKGAFTEPDAAKCYTLYTPFTSGEKN